MIAMRIEDFCDVAEGGLVLRQRLGSFVRHNITSVNPHVNKQLDMLERMGSSNIPLTIKGEAGSGKDRIARYAHDFSDRKSKPFASINCAYYPDVQIANRLFGSNGLLQQSAGGSLYIENIDMLSLQTQQQLWEHIVSEAGKRQNIRFMTCLRETVRSHPDCALIEPLMDYFGSMEFLIPPLRERQEDILLLTMQQLQSIHEQYRVVRRISPKVMTEILTYDWPGNIRQLIKVIDRMAFMADDTLMDSISQLRSCIAANKQFLHAHTTEQETQPAKTLKEMVAEYEIRIINQYIERYGSQRKAAAALGISHSALSIKLTKHYAAPSEQKSR